jgi:O-antigen ligase
MSFYIKKPFWIGKIPLTGILIGLSAIFASLGTISLYKLGSMHLKVYELILIIVIMLLTIKMLEGKNVIINRTYLFLLGAFISITIFSIGNAEYPFVAAKQIFLLLIYVLLSISIVVSCSNRQSVLFIYQGLIYISIALFVVELFHLLTLGNSSEKYGSGSYYFYRPRSFFSEANEFGQYLVFVIGLIVPQLISKKTLLNQKLLLLCFFLDLFLLIPNMSRGSWLGAMAIVVVSIFCLYRTGKIKIKAKSIIKIILLLGIIMIAFIMIIPKIIPVRSTDSIYSVIKARIASFLIFNDETVSERYSFNLIGLHCLEKNPFLGIGFGNVFSVLPFGFDPATGNRKIPEIGNATTANFIIDIAAETGILGISCFLLLLLHAIVTGFKNIRKAKDDNLMIMSTGATVATIGLAVNGISYASHLTPFLWLSIGMTYSLQKIIRKETVVMFPYQ